MDSIVGTKLFIMYENDTCNVSNLAKITLFTNIYYCYHVQV